MTRGAPAGRLDRVDRGTAEGWALGLDEEEACASLEILIDGRVVATTRAGLFRADLAAAGLRGGYAKFQFSIPAAFHDGLRHDLDVRHRGTNLSIDNAPMPFLLGLSERTMAETRRAALKTLVLESNAHGRGFRAAVKAARAVALVGTYHDAASFMAYHRTLFCGLADAGFVVIVVHALGPGASSAEAFDHPSCYTIVRRNVGYDFGSWAVGSFAMADLMDDVDELLLVNDSIVALRREDVQRLVLRARAAPADIVGATESYEHVHHLQSYFLWLGGHFCRSSTFRSFMASLSFSSVKEAVIREGELGFTARAQADGFSTACLICYEQLAQRWLADLGRTAAEIRRLPALSRRSQGGAYRLELLDRLDRVAALVLNGTPVNPCHFFWDTLIQSFDYPFLKREFALINPCAIPTYFRLGRVLAALPETQASILELRRLYGGALVPVFWDGAPAPG